MTQEEKAKAYDEALEIARQIHNGNPSSGTAIVVCEQIFPQLRESEDEKIRKDIIGGLMWQRDNLKSEGPHDNNLILPGFCLTVGEHLKYLEKQKEPKHAPDDLQKSFEAGQASIVDNPEQYGLCKKPELVQQPPITYTYNSNASRDERLKAALLALLNSDLIKVREGGYFTKQDLIEWVERIPTEKPAWSEEDETAFSDLMWCIEQARKSAKDENDMGNIWFAENWVKNRLKSLRPCPSWKPSEDQLNALNFAITYFMHETNYRNPTELRDLYEQLKQL